MELRMVSDEWLAQGKGREQRFGMGWFYDAYLRRCPVMGVENAAGEVMAFANLLSEYQRNELTVDLMRHRRDAENGTMDFLFLSLFEWARREGYASFSLGLSALAEVGGKAGDPVAEQALHYIYGHLNQFYDFQGLHAFKDKFHPVWSPRYLVFSGPTDLLAVVLAIIRADSGDDFIRDYWQVGLQILHLRK
jgi:phosphatidylglycerol lysyltransferase